MVVAGGRPTVAARLSAALGLMDTFSSLATALSIAEDAASLARGYRHNGYIHY